MSPTILKPTYAPSKVPTRAPSRVPSIPTKAPTKPPSKMPTFSPSTKRPTLKPTNSPSNVPSKYPTKSPSNKPSVKPSSRSPTSVPTASSFFGVCTKLNGGTLISNNAGICSAYKSINGNFASYLPADDFARSDLFGKSVRLAFHDAGEVDLTKPTDTMGPDGCLSSSGDNAGLVEPTSPVVTILEPIWQQNCDKISRADFWVLFAKLVLEYTAKTTTDSISISYQYGRKDKKHCEAGKVRLPNGQAGLNEIQRVFVNQMGLTMDDAGKKCFSELIM